MKTTKTVEWTTKNGKHIEVTIEVIREVEDNISYADGWNVNLGKKTVDMMTIEVKADGKHLTRSYHAPNQIDPSNEDNKELISKGAYARLGDAYIGKEQYEMVMAAINEIDNVEMDDEYNQIKAEETAKENAKIAAEEEAKAEYKRQLANGLCPKCGTYCYGDCEANK
jgi:hypothetical protein